MMEEAQNAPAFTPINKSGLGRLSLEIRKRADTPMQELEIPIRVASSMSSEALSSARAMSSTESQEVSSSDRSASVEDEYGSSLSSKESHELNEKDVETEQLQEEWEDKDDDIEMLDMHSNQGNHVQPSTPKMAMHAGQGHDYRSGTNAYDLFVGQGNSGWTPVNSEVGKLQTITSHQNRNEDDKRFLHDFLGPTMTAFVTDRYHGGLGEVWHRHPDQDQLCDCVVGEEEQFEDDEEYDDDDWTEDTPTKGNPPRQTQNSSKFTVDPKSKKEKLVETLLAVPIQEEQCSVEQPTSDPYGISKFERIKTANRELAKGVRLPPQKPVAHSSPINDQVLSTKYQITPGKIETMSLEKSELLLHLAGEALSQKVKPETYPQTSPNTKVNRLMQAVSWPKEPARIATKKRKAEPETLKVPTKKRRPDSKSADDPTDDPDEDIPLLEERYKFVKGGQFITLEDGTIVDQARYLRFRCEQGGKVYVSQYFERKADLLDWNDKDCIERLNHNAQQFFAKCGKGGPPKIAIRWTDEEKQFIIDAVKVTINVDVPKLHQAFNEKFTAKMTERTLRAIRDMVERQIVVIHGHGKRKLKELGARVPHGMVGLDGDLDVAEEFEEDDASDILLETVAASSSQADSSSNGDAAASDKEAVDASAL